MAMALRRYSSWEMVDERQSSVPVVGMANRNRKPAGAGQRLPDLQGCQSRIGQPPSARILNPD